MNPSGYFYFIFGSFQKQAFSGTLIKQKIPLSRDSFKLCGERGIRTPGTVTHTAV
jgi:hypothetical protein